MARPRPSFGAETPAGGEPGFALISVLMLTVLITTLVPMMISLNRESITSVQGDQVRARVNEQARQMFMMAHASMLMHGGLPVGWQRADQAAEASRTDLSNCSGFLDRAGETWSSADTRLSVMQLAEANSPLDGSKLIAGVFRTGYAEVPYENYVVMGCVISGGRISQGAAMRGEFALSGQRFLLLGLEANGT